MKSKTFFVLSISFLLGTIVQGKMSYSLSSILFIFILTIALFTVYKLRRKHVPTDKRSSVLFFLSTCSVLVGMCWFSFATRGDEQSVFAPFIEESVSIIGEVSKEPLRKTDLTSVDIKVEAFSVNDKVIQVDDEYVRAYIPFTQPISYGDLVVISGKPVLISNREGGNFDFVSFMKKDHISYQIFRPNVEIIKNVAHPVVARLKSFKTFFEHTIARAVSEPHASLLSGMLVSGKGALPPDIQTDFIKTGVIHIVVLSGFNVAIIIAFLLNTCQLLHINQKMTFLFIVLGLLSFVIMVGATPPVLRAVLMASVILLSRLSFKKLDPNKVLLFVAIILTIINPYSPAFDPSFQLSFLATFAIINLAPILATYFSKVRPEFLRETVSQTAAAILFVSPFVLYLLGNFSVVAFFVNILILPLVPFIMLAGFLIVLFSFLPWTTFLFALVATVLSTILFKVVEFSANIPFASFTISNVPFWMIIPVYILLFWFMYKKKKGDTLPTQDLTKPH